MHSLAWCQLIIPSYTFRISWNNLFQRILVHKRIINVLNSPSYRLSLLVFLLWPSIIFHLLINSNKRISILKKWVTSIVLGPIYSLPDLAILHFLLLILRFLEEGLEILRWFDLVSWLLLSFSVIISTFLFLNYLLFPCISMLLQYSISHQVSSHLLINLISWCLKSLWIVIFNSLLLPFKLLNNLLISVIKCFYWILLRIHV